MKTNEIQDKIEGCNPAEITAAQHVEMLKSESAISESERLRLESEISLLETERLRLESERLRLESEISLSETERLRLELEVAFLKEELHKALYGKSSERFLPEDPKDFKVAVEHGVDIDERSKAIIEEYPYKPASKRVSGESSKPKRTALPDNLPRIDEVIEPVGLPEGAKCIGEEVTEILEFIPAKLFVRRIIRPKYVIKGSDGEEQIIIAEMPLLPFPKQIAGASVVSKILHSKYIEHLPLYRQHQQFKALGVTVAPSTMCDWSAVGIEKLRFVYDRIAQRIKQSDYVQVDETYMPVVSIDKPNATVKGYIWAAKAPVEGLTLFHWDDGSRAGRVVFDLLGEFQGAIQSDGYGGYNVFKGVNGIVLLGCWAHVRRYFEKALKEDEQNAQIALGMIQYLYRIERQMEEDGLTSQEKAIVRSRDAYPLLLTFQKWMEGIYSKVLPKSRLGRAITYTTNIWNRLAIYTTNGIYEIDNNGIERDIRPITIGRKNYLFCGSNDSAERTAIIYTIAACCKAAGVDMQSYLEDVINRIDELKLSELDQLLPAAWGKRV